MSRALSLFILASAAMALSACGTIQHRESQGHYCRDETRCPYEVR